MELKIPSLEQAYWGLRAMKTVALADGKLDDSERHMMEAVQRIFGTTYSLEELASIAPAELALAFPDPQLRQQLAQGGFKFQVQRVNEGAGAHRLPRAWQSRDISSGACSTDGRWRSSPVGCSPTGPCPWADTAATDRWCSR